MGWLRTSLRRLREERATALAFAALLLVTALVAGVAPRVLAGVARDALHESVSRAQAPARNVQLIEERRVPADGRGPFFGVETMGERREERIPESVRALFVDRAIVVDTARWSVISDTLPRSTIAFRFQPGAEERVRVVDGRLPTGATRTIEVPDPSQPEPEPGEPPGPPAVIRLTVLEVALPAASADTLQVSVGDTIELQIDASDRLARGHEDRAAIDVVGVYEVIDPADDFWLDDQALARPTVREISSENAFFDATALLSPDSYPALMLLTKESLLPLSYTWRFYVDPRRLDADTVDALLVDLRRLETLFPTSLSATAVQETQLRTDLVRVVATQRARWRSAEALMTVVAVGPAAVAGAAVALVAVLAARRRRGSLAVWRARGASYAHLVGTTLAEGLLLALPGAAIAAGVALAALPVGRTEATALAVAGVVAVAVALLLAAVLRATTEESAGRARETSIVRRIGTRRLAFEVLVVVLAGVGAFLLRERGTRVVTAGGEIGPADPLIAAVPLLVGLAVGLLAVRLVPLPIAGLAGLAASRRDLVPVLGLRRATRAGANAVLLVLLATTAVGGFALAALVHLDRSADAVAWQEVGAAYRVSDGGRSLPSALERPGLPAAAVAGAYEARAPLVTPGSIVQVDLLAIDAAEFEVVARGNPAEGTVPAPLLAGTAASPVPAVIGSAITTGPSGIDIGETFELSIDGSRVRGVAVEARPAFAGAPLGGRFVVVSRDQLQALRPDDPYPTTTLFVRAAGDEATADALRAAVTAIAPRADVDSQAVRAAELRAGPIPVAVAVGIGVAALVATAYAALAVIVALALAGAARAVEVAHLRTLGLGRRQAVGLLVVEHGPIVVLAFAAGAALGFGLFVLLRPGLGLEGIIGSPLDVPVRIDLLQVAVLLAGVVVVGGAGLAVGAIIQRRRMLTLALRRGIE
jgi:putative ABC transport system permease protein